MGDSPFLGRNVALQVKLDGARSLSCREADPVRYAEDVRIYCDDRLVVDYGCYHVGGLSADAREGHQGVDV